jgi:mannose-6-phosphate isomerase-like protein (cupin superfamily)
MNLKPSLLKEEILSYDRYERNQIVGIRNSLDIFIQENMTFGEWISSSKDFSTIKVEGLEDTYCKYYPKLNPKNIHLFYTQKSGYSFKWHRDNINVFLHVLQGRKVVQIRDRLYNIHVGCGVVIPKNYLHRVYSDKGTMALSVGFR